MSQSIHYTPEENRQFMERVDTSFTKQGRRPPLTQYRSETLQAQKHHTEECVRLGIEDLDQRSDLTDQDVAEYAQTCSAHMFKTDRDYQADPNYITHNPDLKWLYRSKLIDWLVGLSFRYNHARETIFLTVNIFDRFLSKTTNVKKEKLQLIGIASLYIAAKTEEEYDITVEDVMYISENSYTKQEFLDMEITILNTLKYKLTNFSAPSMTLLRMSSGHIFLIKFN